MMERSDVASTKRDDSQMMTEKEKQIQYNMGESNIPLRFMDKNFESFIQDTEEKENVFSVVWEYAQNFEAMYKSGGSLVFAGKPGTGKTHLATALMIHIIKNGAAAKYMTCMDLIRMLRSTWRRDSQKSEEDILSSIGCTLPLLVLDEIGVQYGTEGEQTILFDVVDKRYRDLMPTVFITNTSKSGFKTYVGDRVFDRLRETSKWVSFDWDSYRPKIFKW